MLFALIHSWRNFHAQTPRTAPLSLEVTDSYTGTYRYVLSPLVVNADAKRGYQESRLLLSTFNVSDCRGYNDGSFNVVTVARSYKQPNTLAE